MNYPYYNNNYPYGQPQPQPQQPYYPPQGQQPNYYQPQQYPPQQPQPQYAPQPYYPPQPQYYPVQPIISPEQEAMKRQQQEMQIQRMRIKAARTTEKAQIFTSGLAVGGAILANLIITVIGVFLIEAFGLSGVYDTSFAMQQASNIVIVDLFGLILPFALMSLILKKRYETPVIPTKKIKVSTCIAWVCFGMGICIAANFLTNGIIELFKIFGYKLTQPESLAPKSVFDCVLLFVSTAIAPAICEEFAMRCTTLGALRKHGKGFAVFAVSVVFGLIHGNVIQFVFAFTIGLVLAYVTIVTDSIIPAMLIHGLNNSMSCIQDTVSFALNDDASDIAAVIMFIAFAVLGVIALIYLAVKKQLIYKPEKKEPKLYRISPIEKFALLIPGFLVPFVLLILVTKSTIVPI